MGKKDIPPMRGPQQGPFIPGKPNQPQKPQVKTPPRNLPRRPTGRSG